jgi:hypothetical protein
MSFGPWLPHLSPEERSAQFRLITGLAALLYCPRSAFVTELRQAEHDAKCFGAFECGANVNPQASARDLQRSPSPGIR